MIKDTNLCSICQEISEIKNNNNPYFVLELSTGYVTIGNYQFYEGYTIFICKIHTDELHKLTHNFKKQFLMDMSLVAEAVFKNFKPKKLNYELLGNTASHLHWHIFPRYSNDPLPKRPIWCMHTDITCNNNVKPSLVQLKHLKNRLLKELINLS